MVEQDTSQSEGEKFYWAEADRLHVVARELQRQAESARGAANEYERLARVEQMKRVAATTRMTGGTKR